MKGVLSLFFADTGLNIQTKEHTEVFCLMITDE